jgi:integrase
MQKQQQESLSINNNDRLYRNFIHSLRTQSTRSSYLSNLRYYMEFLNVKTLKELIDKPQKIIEADIKDYLVYLRNEKKLSHSTAKTYLAPIRKFYYVNSDYNFKWDLIISYLGNDDTDDDDNDEDIDLDQEDRPYTRSEVQKIFNAAQDIRVKIIISLLCSAGLRHGVLPNLKLRDLEKIEKYNLYKITAYRRSKKFKYYTFCSPECTKLIDSYLEYRKNQGENLNDNSPLIREQFSTKDKLKANNPRHLTLVTFRSLINDVLTKYTNLRKKLKFDHENKRKEGRNPTMLTHGFRKYFTVECTKAGIYPEFIELMLGHKLKGMRSHYMIPDIQTLLEGTTECKGYVTAIDSLTINDENRLQKQVKELKEQDDYQKYVIDKKIKEMEEQNKILNQKLIKYEEHVKYTKEWEQKINDIMESKFEEQHLNREYESIPVNQKGKKDSVFKNLMEIREKRIKHENDYENLLREHVDDDYY